MFNAAGGCSPLHFEGGRYYHQPYGTSAHELFAKKTPKVGNIDTKSRAKKSPSDHRRFIIRQSSTEVQSQITHIEQRKKGFIKLAS
jgi:hypothetical protein